MHSFQETEWEAPEMEGSTVAIHGNDERPIEMGVAKQLKRMSIWVSWELEPVAFQKKHMQA